MSQASKRKAQRLVREREQVARFIAVVSPVSPPPIVQQDRGYRPRGKVGMLMAGGGFDVHAAREAALTLVALEAEQAVFEDWCRARGKGPENHEPGAFHDPWRTWVVNVDEAAAGAWELVIGGVTVASDNFYANASPAVISGQLAEADTTHDIWPDSPAAVVIEGLVASVDIRAPAGGEFTISCVSEVPIAGGWPGNLAREYAWDRCPNKCQPFMNLDEITPRGSTTLSDGSVSRSYTATPGEWRRFYAQGVTDWDGDWTERDIVQCIACVDGRVRHGDRDPRAPMGRRLAKLGRLVLAALEGQPSECQRLDCEAGYIDGLAPTDELPGGIPCPDCHCTGHSLRGVMPPIEWSTALVRWAEDADRHARLGRLHGRRLDPVQSRILDESTEACWRLRPEDRTRVVPRGAHRHRGTRALPRDADLDLKISQRMHDTMGGPVGCDRWPGWRRGELGHPVRRSPW